LGGGAKEPPDAAQKGWQKKRERKWKQKREKTRQPWGKVRHSYGQS